MRAKFYFILIFNFIFDVYIFGGLGWPTVLLLYFLGHRAHHGTTSTSTIRYDTCTQMKNSMFHP